MKISRKELYDLVWKEPLSKLARQFDVSDRALAKKCDAYNIPRPPQGHWVRLECGHEVSQIPLPKLDDPYMDMVHFMEKPKEEKLIAMIEPDLLEGQEERALAYQFPKAVNKYHRSIQAFRSDFKSRNRTDNYGRIETALDIADIGVKVTPALLDRACLFLQGLIDFFEEFGWKFKEDKAHYNRKVTWGFLFKNEFLHIEIKELVKRVERKEQDYSIYRWGKQYDYIPLGTLAFTITNIPKSSKQTRWQDGKKGVLEEQLFDIVMSFSRGYEYARQRSIRRQIEHEKYEREAAIQRENKRLQRIENERKKYLFELSDSYNRIQSIRDFLEALALRAKNDERFADWLDWASGVLNELDPLSNPEMILEEHDNFAKRFLY